MKIRSQFETVARDTGLQSVCGFKALFSLTIAESIVGCARLAEPHKP